MNYVATIRNAIVCGQRAKASTNEEKMREDSPPSENGVDSLGSTRGVLREHRQTIPATTPPQPHPSHFNTAPVLVTTGDARIVADPTDSPLVSPLASPTSEPQIDRQETGPRSPGRSPQRK